MDASSALSTQHSALSFGDAELTGRNVLVMGLGRFGGGIGVTRWLAGRGARVTVTDRDDKTKLADSLRLLQDLPITYHLGGHRDEDLDQCDLLVVSPAVDKPRSEFFQKALAAGIPWTSEMNLFFEACRAPVIGVTGTSGKSTTTAMIHEVLRHGLTAGGVGYANLWLGGNIGLSLLDDLPRIQPADLVVLELSSFQLDDIAAIRRSPHIAVLTNLSDNHLDRHGTMEAYLDAKLNSFRYQGPGDYAVVNAADPALVEKVRAVARHQNVYTFGLSAGVLTPQPCATALRAVLGCPAALPSGERLAEEPLVSRLAQVIRLPGRHNLENASAAYAVARLVGLSHDVILEGLARFPGLEHRLEFVAEIDGVRYYNDSKATTPAASMLALHSFHQPVVMLVGGSHKGASYDELGRALAQSAKAVVCYGATRRPIADAVNAAKASASATAPPVTLTDSLELAVASARSFVAPGDVVVLSPACASYDMFLNYEQRGAAFKSLVKNLRPGHTS